ncbi:MbcA/ParS/Xre antitoxin family protein [Pseudomonas sp. 2822-17]|uniref:MbcA/ParS/Xre antitoxin family protein n=1 Tax=Pseudomonas sp. 2822-17 TaxID=1712678 RepID=UPI002113F4FA|nr:MbcA/ParS/Xre antitoxin family protein [Pseudomonas sp. 2822-17]
MTISIDSSQMLWPDGDRADLNEESVMEFAEPIRHHAERVFGCKVKAAVWMMHPRAVFEGLSALGYAQSELTYQHVIEELERIKHGFVC